MDKVIEHMMRTTILCRTKRNFAREKSDRPVQGQIPEKRYLGESSCHNDGIEVTGDEQVSRSEIYLNSLKEKNAPIGKNN